LHCIVLHKLSTFGLGEKKPNPLAKSIQDIYLT
jgi:hypothetical protein